MLTLLVLAIGTVGQAETVTKKLFLPVAGADQVLWSGSVVGACSDSTTYALRCSGTPTAGSRITALETASNPVASAFVAGVTSAVGHRCDANKPPFTVTEGPSGFLAASETVIDGVTAVAENSCAISGTTSASCAVSGSVQSGSVETTAAAPVVYYADGQLPVFDVAITAGAQKFASATDAVCQSGATSLGIPIVFTAVVLTFGICAVIVL